MLLEWQSARHVERRERGSARATWRAMWPVSLLAVGMLVLAGREMPALVPLLLLWAASPAIARSLGHPAVRAQRGLSDDERATARRYAEVRSASNALCAPFAPGESRGGGSPSG